MLNIVWPFFLIISIIYAIFAGNLDQLNNSIFESTNTAVNLCITLVGTMCLWNGIMNIASKTSAMKKITKILGPIIKILFPKINKNSKVYEEISMNVVANVLGLGNAATPLRFKSDEIYAREKSE
jgi:spore maturation protein A